MFSHRHRCIGVKMPTRAGTSVLAARRPAVDEGRMSLLRAGALESGLTLAGRALGYGRTAAVAAVLGAGGTADAFFVALRRRWRCRSWCGRWRRGWRAMRTASVSR